MTISIEPATDQLRELLRTAAADVSFPLLGSYEVDDYLDKLRRFAQVAVYRQHAAILGFIAFYCNDPARDCAYITMLVVAPQARGRGVGALLVDVAVAAARQNGFRRCRLEVHQDNHAALALYLRCGFGVCERRGQVLLLEQRW